MLRRFIAALVKLDKAITMTPKAIITASAGLFLIVTKILSNRVFSAINHTSNLMVESAQKLFPESQNILN